MNQSCTRCHRPLSNPASVQNGMGPVCAARTTARTISRQRGEPESDYSLIKVDAEQHMVWIIDNDLGRSVTNDADAVVAALLAEYPGHRIFYRDTMENWDELQHNGTRFIGFAPARAMLP